MTVLCAIRESRLPVTAECISPNVFEGKTLAEIGELHVWEGNKKRKLREFFRIETSAKEEAGITIKGDVANVKRIGESMTNGSITIEGNVGMHLGASMKGGKIIVHGNAGSWAGSMMKDGQIEIHGNVGGYLASPYRGSSEGIKAGLITVHGNVGTNAGSYMAGGAIKISGSASQFAGFRMRDGTMCVHGDCMERAAACMTGGKLIIRGHLEAVLPTFTIDSVRPKVRVDQNEVLDESFYVFLGDLVEQGKGKLYVSKEKNSHLSSYEKLL